MRRALMLAGAGLALIVRSLSALSCLEPIPRPDRSVAAGGAGFGLGPEGPLRAAEGPLGQRVWSREGARASTCLAALCCCCIGPATQRGAEHPQPEHGGETMEAAAGHPESQVRLQEVNANGLLENREQPGNGALLPGTGLERDTEAAPAESAESRERLQEPLANKHWTTGGEPEPQLDSLALRRDRVQKRQRPGICTCLGHRCNYKRRVPLAVMIFGLLIAVVVLPLSLSGRSPAVLGPTCLDTWVGYQGKCFYFSESEGSWTDSRSRCSALGASLAGIDTPQEMNFLLRYKGKFDHWIGLRRDHGQPWKWANGTEFNHLFVIGGDGDCAYLNENRVGSLRCTSEGHWICSKPDGFTSAKETPAGGGS